jgi:hypothetical protein
MISLNMYLMLNLCQAMQESGRKSKPFWTKKVLKRLENRGSEFNLALISVAGIASIELKQDVLSVMIV